MKKKLTVLMISMLLMQGCGGEERTAVGARKISDEAFPVPAIDYSPGRYLCRKAPDPIVIDGRLEDESWNRPWVLWTSDFVDIEGGDSPEPAHRTRAKMLWDDDYFYVAAEIYDTDIWATITERDAVIFHDNDFEVFIDPDGDSHEYYELEINAFGTVWDLFLVKPYRDGGPAVNSWDIGGLKTAVHVDGTLNRPGDRDRSWTVEIAIPWNVLGECAHRKVPPDESDVWFVNFSRVQWDVRTENNTYVKVTDPETGRPASEHNWVWSPQGIVNMHYPEMWGMVMFTNVMKSYGADSFEPSPIEQARWTMRRIYYAEKTHFLQYGSYTSDPGRLALEGNPPYGYVWPPEIYVTPGKFEAVVRAQDGRSEIRIDDEGRLTGSGEDYRD